MQTVPVYQTEDIREIEKYLFSLNPKPHLMEIAGKTVANVALHVAPRDSQTALVLAGPGDNGGDAYVTARHLKNANYSVVVLSLSSPETVSQDRSRAIADWKEMGGLIKTNLDPEEHFDLVIDGLFGIGLTRPLSGDFADLVHQVNQLSSTVIAIDIPSGLDSDTGNVMGCSIHAHHTVTFLGYKVGLHTGEGPDYSGIVHFSDLNMDDYPRPDTSGYLIGSEVLQNVLVPRKKSSHKGSHGQIAIIGGDEGMVGAILLAGRAALKLGAGRVFIGSLRGPLLAVDQVQPELMIRVASELLSQNEFNCIAIGPGLGNDDLAHQTLSKSLSQPVPVILDAGALNLVADHNQLKSKISDRDCPTVLTPHPKEAARLLKCSVEEIQSDRVHSALSLANEFNSEVILKGVGSVCAFPDGNWFINTTGNPGMACAGMGDVLTGIVGALITQGAYSHSAVVAGVYLHGLAADQLLSDNKGPIGMTASETIDTSRSILNQHLTGILA